MCFNSPHVPLTKCPSGCRTKSVRRGLFRRARDNKLIQRYLCRGCDRSYSESTGDPCFGQKKRDLNGTIAHLLTGGYSQRRAARDLGVTRKTIVRKFVFLGLQALDILSETNRHQSPAAEWEFDELITSEHTKCKPTSVLIAVEAKTRRILGFRVGTMPAQGLLATKSRRKYGRRPDERRRMRDDLFSELKLLVKSDAVIKSDLCPHYPESVARHFPNATHQRFKGRRGCVIGQGELKRTGKDPIFALNHTCAMLRANINRLVRRTWCTTKLQDRLRLHIALYAVRHNLDLIQRKIH